MKKYKKRKKYPSKMTIFKCPECGSKNDKIRGYEFFAKDLKTSDPWFEEFEFINCLKCRRSIPGSLGYRYGKTKTYDKAKKKWNDTFKNLFREYLVKNV